MQGEGDDGAGPVCTPTTGSQNWGTAKGQLPGYHVRKQRAARDGRASSSMACSPGGGQKITRSGERGAGPLPMASSFGPIRLSW
jgi:hypothetical protein